MLQLMFKNSVIYPLHFPALPATSQRLGVGGASTAVRTGAKLPNLHKLSGETLPRLRQTARYMPYILFIINTNFLLQLNQL
jgi:hypothetical protein